MTDAEVIAAARDIVNSETHRHVHLIEKTRAIGIARELLRLHEAQQAYGLADLRKEREAAIASIDGVDFRDIDQRDNANADELRAKLLGAGIQLAAAKAEVEQINTSVEAAHSWMDEAVGDYCKPADADSREVVADCLRLRCESAAKRMTELRAALREQVRHCGRCDGGGITWVPDQGGDLMDTVEVHCPTCKHARDLLAEEVKP